MSKPFSPESPENLEMLLEELTAAHRSGKGLVSLAGAGVSVPAGLPTAPELKLYLALCVGMALGFDKSNELTKCKWHPKYGCWPAMRGDWQLRADNVIQDLARRAKAPNCDYLHQRAHASLIDWRLALQFIASLVPPKAGPIPSALGAASAKVPWSAPDLDLAAPDPRIIDSFFNFLMAGKQPAITHRMLAHLAKSCRAKVALTLNFDDLLEQAYLEAGLNPHIFEIHADAGMPPWSLLGRKEVIVKMHGGKFGLRADPTLDGNPTENDRWSLRSYLLQRDWTEEDETRYNHPHRELPPANANLLIAGFSGTDRRIILLLQDALTHLSGFKIYYIAHSLPDAETFRKFRERAEAWGVSKDRIHIVQHTLAGPLFMELYQRLTFCMPPAGLSFPVTWRLPLVPKPDSTEYGALSNNDDASRARVETANDWLLKQTQLKSATNSMSDQLSPLIVWSLDKIVPGEKSQSQEWGVRPFCWDLYHAWSARYHCFWLSIEHLAALSEMKLRVSQGINTALGQPHYLPELADDDPRQYLEDLRDRLSQTARPLVLFLNLRGRCGLSANMFDGAIELPAKGDSYDWARDTSKAEINRELWQFIRELSKIVHIVVMSREGDDIMANAGIPASIEFPHTPSKAGDDDMVGRRIKNAMDWLESPSPDGSPPSDELKIRRRRLLFAIATRPQIRHFTAFVSWSISQPAPEEKWTDVWDEVIGMVKHLTEIKILRRAAGGFLWTHWRIRAALRKSLGLSYDLFDDESWAWREGLHIGLADWCMTFFASTRDPLAAFQSIYHRCRVADLALRRLSETKDPVLQDQERVRIRSTLCEAFNAIESAKASLLAWGNSLEAERCFKGYTNMLSHVQEQSEKHRSSQPRQERLLRLARTTTLLYEILLNHDFGRPLKVLEALRHLRITLHKDGSELQKDWSAEYFRAMRRADIEEALAFMHLRCYDDAEQRFLALAANPCKGLDDQGNLCLFPIEKIFECSMFEIETHVANWAHEMCEGPLQAKLRFPVRRHLFFVLRRLLEIQLLRHEAHTLSQRCVIHPGPPGALDSPTYLDKAVRIYIAARMLPRFFPEGEFSEIRVERSRLHNVFAGVLACKGDFANVRRHLNEAGVAAAHLPESEEPMARVVVDLREVYCSLEKLGTDMGPIVARLMSTWDSPGTMASEFQRLGGTAAFPHQQMQAALNDMQMILDRVDDSMTRHRKSLFWWMTHRRYQMTCFQYRELMRFWKRTSCGGSLLPEVEFESWHELEAARVLFIETARRVTTDILQLARISHAALNMIRLACLGRDLASLAQNWREPLEYATQRLTSLCDKLAKNGKTVDQSVLLYADHVIREISTFANGYC